jgi:hypothetical protein
MRPLTGNAPDKVTTLQARRGLRFGDQTLRVQIFRADDPLERTDGPQPFGQFPRIYALDPRHAVGAKVTVHVTLGPEAAGHLAQFPDDESFQPQRA